MEAVPTDPVPDTSPSAVTLHSSTQAPQSPSSDSLDSLDSPPLIPLLVLPASNLLSDPPAKPTQADEEFCRKHNLKYDCHTKTLDKEPSLVGKFLRVGLDSHTRNFLGECLDQVSSPFDAGYPMLVCLHDSFDAFLDQTCTIFGVFPH